MAVRRRLVLALALAALVLVLVLALASLLLRRARPARSTRPARRP